MEIKKNIRKKNVDLYLWRSWNWINRWMVHLVKLNGCTYCVRTCKLPLIVLYCSGQGISNLIMCIQSIMMYLRVLYKYAWVSCCLPAEISSIHLIVTHLISLKLTKILEIIKECNYLPFFSGILEDEKK